MYLIKVALLFLYYFNYCYCASTRVWRHKSDCGKGGFICSPGSKRVIFECPVKTKEYHIYVNEFNAPPNMESLTIRNCKTLTILLRCTKYKWENKKLKYLQVSNIERLKIQSMKNYQSQLPPEVVFEDIKVIENIPSYSFSQINKSLNKIRCALPVLTFKSLLFRNVTINAMDLNAFHMPYKFGNVTFTDVRINKMAASSVIVNHDDAGVFLLDKSSVNALKPFSFKIAGKRAIISDSKFESIPSSGISGNVETFNFINNSVKILHSHALSILASDVFISSNRFDSLRAGAFEQIGPRKLGRLKFIYDFSRNDINFMDAGCLHPDLSARNVSFESSFTSNRISCTCDQLDWLFSTLDHVNATEPKSTFYKKVFDEEYGNTCFSSCNLPLMSARGMIKKGKCIKNITVEQLCQNKDRSTTIISSPQLSDLSRFTTSSIKTPTMPSTKLNSDLKRNITSSIKPFVAATTKSNSIATSTVEDTVKSFTQTSKISFSNRTMSSILSTPRINPTTATVRTPTIKATKHQPINNTVGEATSTITSKPNFISINNLTFSIPLVTSASSPSERSKISSAAFRATTLSPVMDKVSERLGFVSSTGNHFISILLLFCSILSVLINN